MSWNNSCEKKKFYSKQCAMVTKFRKAGMTKEQIKEICIFDFDVYKSNRRFFEHTQALEFGVADSTVTADDAFSTMYDKYLDELSVDECIALRSQSRYAWIDDIDDERLLKTISELTDNEIKLLSVIVFEKYTQREAAMMFSISPQRVSCMYTNIKNKLRTQIEN